MYSKLLIVTLSDVCGCWPSGCIRHLRGLKKFEFSSVDFALGFLGDSAEVWEGAENNLQEQV